MGFYGGLFAGGPPQSPYLFAHEKVCKGGDLFGILGVEGLGRVESIFWHGYDYLELLDIATSRYR